MTAEEQKKMQELEAENAALKERLLVAQRTLAKYAQMLFGQKTERCRLPEKPEELTGSLFEQEMDPAEQARLDREAGKALAEQDKLIHVEAHDRKVRKAIDTSRLEVKEEHLYPDLDNKEDYTEMAPEVTDSLALVPRQMYIRRIIRHKFVLKSNLQVADPDRKAFRIAALPPAPLHKCMADASLLADSSSANTSTICRSIGRWRLIRSWGSVSAPRPSMTGSRRWSERSNPYTICSGRTSSPATMFKWTRAHCR